MLKSRSKWFLGLTLAVAFSASAVLADEQVIRIQVGRNDKNHNVADLQRRIWELERAVSQMQRRIYQLEAAPIPPPEMKPVRWTCSVNAFGKTYVRTADSRGEAQAGVAQECANASNEMHCRDVNCSQ